MYFCTTYLVKEKNYNTIGGLNLSSLLLPSEHVTKCMFTIFHEMVHVSVILTTPVLLFGLHSVTPRRGRVSVCLPSLD